MHIKAAYVFLYINDDNCTLTSSVACGLFIGVPYAYVVPEISEKLLILDIQKSLSVDRQFSNYQQTEVLTLTASGILMYTDNVHKVSRSTVRDLKL